MLFGGGAFGTGLVHEGGVLMNVISALRRETPGRSLQKTVVYETKIAASPDTESTSTLTLDFSRSVRNKWVLYAN